MGFMIFGLIWLMIFIVDKVKFIIMSSAAQYYFTSDRKKEGGASVCSAGYQSYFKHFGSIAFGTLLHTVILLLKILVEIASHDAQESDNGVYRLVACLLKCCVGCIESLIEHLNTMAYAMIAISGDSYCTSAWHGMLLHLKHCVKFYFASNLASGLVFIGMLAIVGANMGTCYLLMAYGFDEAKDVYSIWGPIGVVGGATLITAIVFLGPFDDAVTATLMCLAVDMELHGEPKHGPPSYHEKLDALLARHGGHSALAAAHDPELLIDTGYSNRHNMKQPLHQQHGARGNNMF